jgi:hypothetical protein
VKRNARCLSAVKLVADTQGCLEMRGGPFSIHHSLEQDFTGRLRV